MINPLEFERLYEALILHPDDHLTLNILWNRLSSTDSDTVRAAEETLSDHLRHQRNTRTPAHLDSLAG